MKLWRALERIFSVPGRVIRRKKTEVIRVCTSIWQLRWKRPATSSVLSRITFAPNVES